jgi:hypothetical protein
MIDIVFNGRFASTLTEYNKLRQVNRQVLALPMYLGLGDISQGTFIENRQTVYKIQYAHQENSEYHAAQAVQNLRNALKLLDEAIARNEPLRAWWSDDVNDYCGFLWLCNYLKNSTVEMSSIKVPMTFVTSDNALAIISGLGDLTPENIDEFNLFDLEKSVSKNRRTAYSYYWRDLRSENNPIRAVINGKCISQSIDFYDRFILLNLSYERFRKIIRVIGETIGNYPFAPEWWYRHRIDYLVSKGSLEYKIDPDMMVGKIRIRH